MPDKLSDKEIFDYIRAADIPQIPPLKKILSDYVSESITAFDALHFIRDNPSDFLLVDARSEKEFNDSSLPGAQNFPVLTNNERHQVGLIYKKYSQTAALWLAINYAEPKLDGLKSFLASNNAYGKKVIVYCWRGGGRSGYLSGMIHRLGFAAGVVNGGFRSYRRLVNSTLSLPETSFNLIELSGLTGSGKTQLLRQASYHIPVVDLENSARHYSSLLGRVPYELCGINEVANQSTFENSIFSDLIMNTHALSIKDELYLIESESRKVGDYMIPTSLFLAMQNSPSIKVESSLENRIKRINDDYFGRGAADTVPMQKVMKKKEAFFRQQLSNAVYDDLIEMLNAGNTHDFTELMLTRYYDKKYKDKGKKPIAVVNADIIGEAVKEIKDTYQRVKARMKTEPATSV